MMPVVNTVHEKRSKRVFCLEVSLFYEQRKKDRPRDRQTWRQRKRETDRQRKGSRERVSFREKKEKQLIMTERHHYLDHTEGSQQTNYPLINHFYAVFWLSYFVDYIARFIESLILPQFHSLNPES